MERGGVRTFTPWLILDPQNGRTLSLCTTREVAPETNCFAPFWEMDEGSAGYIDVSQLLPSPLRSVSASLVLGLHGRYRERYHVGLPKIAFRLPSEAGAHAQLAHAVVKRIDS